MNQDSLYQAFKKYNEAKEYHDKVQQVMQGTYVDPQNQGYESGALAATQGLTGTARDDDYQHKLNALSEMNAFLNGRNTELGLQAIQGANDVIQSAVQYNNRDRLTQAGDFLKSTGGLATLATLGGLALVILFIFLKKMFHAKLDAVTKEDDEEHLSK